jgi:hypothetical protein
MSDYFSELGKSMARELARNPVSRERIRTAADSALLNHLARPPSPTAQDAMPASLKPSISKNPVGKPSSTVTKPKTSIEEDQDMPSWMPPRGSQPGRDQSPPAMMPMMDQEPGEMIDAGTAMMLMQQIMQSIDPEQMEEFLTGLQNMLQGEPAEDGTLELTHGNGNGNGNGMPQNGVPKNNPGALDLRRRRPAKDNQMRRPGAMDSSIATLNRSAFLKRFPTAAQIRFSGTGR